MATVAIVAAVIGWLGLAVLGSVLYQVMRQQGGVLLRLEEVEQRMAAVVGVPAAPASARPQGLAVGAELEAPRLPDYTGRVWGLHDVEGDQLLLVHWNPACGFCERIADDLAALLPALRKRDTELVLASRGDVESNREFAQHHGLRCPVLLLDGSGEVDVFAGLGTPVAYLLDAQRRVTRPLAFGADEVLDLAAEIAGRPRIPGQRPLSESRIQRNGLPAGTPAPDFQLLALEGETVSLAKLRGRPVLLVFSQPDCNPCTAVAAELQELHERHGAELAVVAISRGDVEENLRKRDETGARYPILLQPGWEVSRAYGIFETPVAFLIDERGVIAHDVARGSDEIRELARRAVDTSAIEVMPLRPAIGV